MNLDANIPEGPIADKWTNAKFNYNLINPANKRKYSVIVVGSGLAGGAAAATLGELGYQVKCFCYQDSPRRAHSIAGSRLPANTGACCRIVLLAGRRSAVPFMPAGRPGSNCCSGRTNP